MPSTSDSRSSSNRRPAQLGGIFRSKHALPLIVILLAGVALHLAGAPPVAVPLWATVAALALLFTGVDHRWVTNDPALGAGAVFLAISVLQLVPLPPFVLRAVDMTSSDLSASALSPLHIDLGRAWRPLHLDPGNGYADVHYVVGLLCAYLAVRQLTVRGSGQSVADALAAIPLLIVGLALAHKFIGLDRVYGEVATRGAAPPIMSPFLNANHLAAVSGAGTILWLARSLDTEYAPARIGQGVAAMLCATVTVLTLSRGGVIATIAGVVILLFAQAAAKSRSARRSRLLRAGLIAAMVVLLGGYAGWEAIRAEFAFGDMSKIAVIQATVRSLKSHWLLGAGSGGLHAAVTYSGVLPDGVTALRAENLPIDLIAAVGVVGLLGIGAFGVRWLFSTLPRGPLLTSRYLGPVVALWTILLHDMLDFSLWLGGTGYLAASLAGWLAAEKRLALSERGKVRPTLRWPVVLVVLASGVAGLVTAGSSLAADRETVEAMVARGQHDSVVLRRALRRHPGDPYLVLLGAASALRARDRNALRFVNRAMLIAPQWRGPHVMLARTLAAAGFRSQAILEIRRSAELTTGYQGGLVDAVAAIAPSPLEFDRMIPDGARGTSFLRVLAPQTGLRGEVHAEIDRLLLERDPNDPGALSRAAARARASGDSVTQTRLIEQLIAAHPDSAEGYLALAQARDDAGDLEGAERELSRGLSRASNNRAVFLSRLAHVQARRRESTAMRRTMEQLLEAAGADFDARVAAYGQLGEYEVLLNNDALALAAYERGETLAFPSHPFLAEILAAASRLGDNARVRGACNSLLDHGGLTESQRAICRAAGTTRPLGAL